MKLAPFRPRAPPLRHQHSNSRSRCFPLHKAHRTILTSRRPPEFFSQASPDIGSDRGDLVKIKADGDLHIALADASGGKPGIIVAEIPAKAEWCDLRKIVFSWTQVEFPFRIRSGRKLKIAQPPIITVIGNAFFDNGHAPADHSNRRTDLEGYTAWEIHPVMKLDVQ